MSLVSDKRRAANTSAIHLAPAVQVAWLPDRRGVRAMLTDLIPLPYRLAGIGLVLGIVAGAAALQVHRFGAARYTAGQAEVQGRWTTADLQRAEVAILADRGARAEEQRRIAAQQEIEDAHQAELQRLRADAVIADAAAGRLQQRVAALVAAARRGAAGADPAVVGSSPAADDAAGVLADVLGRCVARVRLLATVADERGAAGSACISEYQSLSQATESQAN